VESSYSCCAEMPPSTLRLCCNGGLFAAESELTGNLPPPRSTLGEGRLRLPPDEVFRERCTSPLRRGAPLAQAVQPDKVSSRGRGSKFRPSPLPRPAPPFWISASSKFNRNLLRGGKVFFPFLRLRTPTLFFTSRWSSPSPVFPSG